jgi:hypothetical protein
MAIELKKPDIGSTDWGNDVNQNWTDIEGALEKVKADPDDPSTGFLSDKVDGSTLEVDMSSHQLKIKDGGVQETQLDDDAVTELKLASGAVTSNKIYDGAVVTAKIDDGAIDRNKIQDGEVTGAKLEDHTVPPEKLLETYSRWRGVGTSDPGDAREGDLYWNSDYLVLRVYDGSSWHDCCEGSCQ